MYRTWCIVFHLKVSTLMSDLGGALSLMLGISIVMMLEFFTLTIKLLMAACSS